MTLWVAVCLYTSTAKDVNYWFESVKRFNQMNKCIKKTATYNKSNFGKNYQCHSVCITK